MPAQGNVSNLKPVQSKEEARERGRLGGIKSGIAKRAKKNLQQLAKTILETQVNDDKAKGFLHSFGLDEQDQNYQALMIAKLLNKALKETDVKAIQTLTTLAGFDGGTLSLAEDTSVETIDAYQKIYIPNNGRDSYDSPYLSPQPGPQTAFMCSPADIIIYGGAAGGGKGSPFDELILTPNGYKYNGLLQIGDDVCTPFGTTSKVIGLFPLGKRKVYNVTFIDGASVRVTGDHLWYSKKAKDCSNKWRNRTTDELIELISKGHNILIPLCKPVEFKARKSLTIKPYTLGVLLGDGSLTAFPCSVTKNDNEIFAYIKDDGYDTKVLQTKDRCHTEAIYLSPNERQWLKDIKLNVKSAFKFIPEEYKYASVNERFSLLQGLMDTDGYADDRGHCTYATTSKRLAEDVQWLCRSLGCKATITPKAAGYRDKQGNKVQCNISYEVYIQSAHNEKLFRLERKKARCIGKQFNGGRGNVNRRITSIEYIGDDYCQCIKLEDNRGLYITKDFIVTHNTYALLMEGLRHKDIAGFNGLVLRKNYTQITSPGGLWEASNKIYSQVQGAMSKISPVHHWTFAPSGANIRFGHLASDKELSGWQGSEICYLAFDELTHFSRHQFLYMLSRNRSTCGIRPYVRATCNPDSDSWVAEFISWWINQDTGYPIYERSGVIRYMCVVNDTIFWGSNPHELAQEHGVNVEECKSVTFIASKLTDNKVLMAKDPSYMANLKALAEIDKERLLYGNWKIRPAAGMYFKTEQFTFVDAVPKNIVAYARSWDLAATEPTPLNPDPDATAGVLMGLLDDGRVIVLDVKRKQIKANDARNLLRNMAAIDQAKYKFVQITIPQDPGQAGKAQAQSLVSMLAGYSVEIVSPTGSKEVRATPFASQVQAGNVLILKGEWNDMYLSELESFPESKHDDMVDASSDAFNKLMHATNWGGLTS